MKTGSSKLWLPWETTSARFVPRDPCAHFTKRVMTVTRERQDQIGLNEARALECAMAGPGRQEQ
eukprot:1351739-Amphidinium_carterae.1